MIEIVASDGEHKVAAEMEGICYSYFFAVGRQKMEQSAKQAFLVLFIFSSLGMFTQTWL